MAVNDPTQDAPVPVTIAPPPAAPDLTGYLVGQLAPLAQQLVAAQTGGLEQRLTSVEAQLAQQVSAVATQLEPAVLHAGTALLTGVSTDPVIRRDASVIVAAAASIGALLVLALYLAGNPYAGRIVAGVPATAVGLALWFSRIQSVLLPSKPTVAP